MMAYLTNDAKAVVGTEAPHKYVLSVRFCERVGLCTSLMVIINCYVENSSCAIQRFFPRSGVNYTCIFHVILS